MAGAGAPGPEVAGLPFVVAVPSYRRAAEASSKTLALLERHGVAPAQVFIFVADEAEHRRYREVLGSKWPNVVVGVLTLWRQRNFITRYFPEGTHIVSLDDDVEEVFRMRGDPHSPDTRKPVLEPLHAGGLVDVFLDAPRKMARCGAFLWSLNVSDNPFFMKESRACLRNGLCNGFFWGCVNRHRSDLLIQHGDGHEDVERTARYFHADGAVLRYREFCAKTRCKTNSGGLQARMSKEERKRVEDEGAQALVKEFPHQLRLEPDSILGLKFLSSCHSLLLRHSMLSLTQFKEIVALRKASHLAGARCVALRQGVKGGRRSRLCGATVEKVGEQDFEVRVRSAADDEDVGLYRPSASALYAMLQDEVLAFVWIPAQACTKLGLEFVEWSPQLDPLFAPSARAAPAAALAASPAAARAGEKGERRGRSRSPAALRRQLSEAASPSKAATPTKAGMPAFLQRWLGSKQGPSAAPSPEAA